MKSIKIKVKHIILTLLIFIVVFAARPFVVGKIMLIRADNYLEKDKKEMATAYYRKYIENFPGNEAAIDTFQKVLDGIPRSDMYLQILADSRGGPGLLSLSRKEKLKKLNEDFSLLKKNHDKEKLFEVQEDLAEVNFQAGNFKEAVRLLEEGISLDNYQYAHKAAEQLSALYFELGKFNKAEETINKFTTRFKKNSGDDQEGFIRTSVWDALLLRNRDSYYELKKECLPETGFYQITYGYRSLINFKPDQIKEFETNIFGEGEANLSGTVKKAGQPLGNVLVFLQKKSPDSEYPYSSSISFMADNITMTDINGKYQFRDVEEGEYFLGVGVSYFRVNNYFYHQPGYTYSEGIRRGLILGQEPLRRDIEFNPPIKITKAPEKDKEISSPQNILIEWEKYPGAAYYNLIPGVRSEHGSRYTLISNKTEDTSGQLFLDPQTFNNFISMDQEGLEPDSIIGYENIPCDLTYRVTAYDEDGNKIAESIDTENRYQLKWVPEHKMSTADSLLMNREYEEAITAYEKAVRENPEDIHSSKVLANLYSNGYRIDENNEIYGKDLKKALKYYTNVYKNDADQDILMNLYRLNLHFGNIKEADKYLTIELKNSSDSAYMYKFKGEIELYKGNFSAAEKYFLKGIEKENIGFANLLPLYLLQGRYNDALYLETQYPDSISLEAFLQVLKPAIELLDQEELKTFYRELDKGNIGKTLTNLPDTETGIFYQALSSLILKPSSSYDLYDYYDKQQTPELKAFLKVMGQSHIGSIFPAESVEELDD